METIFECKMFRKPNKTRYVNLLVDGIETKFVVDTGCVTTAVTYRQVQKWGLEDKIFKDRNLEFVEVAFEFGDYESIYKVIVNRTMADNLLGQNVFKYFSCIIDFKTDTLTLREFEPVAVKGPLKLDCEIAGMPTKVQLDTGASHLLWGGLTDAARLNLPLVDVSSKRKTICTVANRKVPIRYVSYNVFVRTPMKEASGTFIETTVNRNRPVILGMDFLDGLVIEIAANGTFRLNGKIYKRNG